MLDILIEATLRTTLIAAAALLALFLLRVRAAAACHRVLTIVLGAMLILPFWIAWGPDLTWRVLPSIDSSVADVAYAGSDSAAPVANAMSPSPATTTAATTPAPTPEPTSPAVTRFDWQATLLGLYLAVAAALLMRLLIGTLRARGLTREARRVDGRLTSDRVATPLTVGALAPQILLPDGWDRWPAERLAAVLAHEHAHVQRRDPLIQWLALLNRALFWFHPLAWWLERRLAGLAEEACDAAVLARGHAPDAYSEHLIELAHIARRGAPQAIGLSMPGASLPTRIAKILEGVAPPSSRAATVCVVALSSTAALTLGGMSLAQQSATSLIPSADSFTPLPEYWHGDDEWRLEVAAIATAEEREAYQTLRSFEARDRFIGAFWLRRDPTPGTLHNEFKKEYERRIHYAQSTFRDESSGGSYGYQSTPGAVYTLLGHPDSIETAEGDDAHETWRYSNVNGTGQAFTVRVARSHRIGCGPSYEIVEPAPQRTFQGSASLGGAAPLTVAVYPLGLVTVSVPLEHGTVRSIRTGLDDGRDAARAGAFHFSFMFNGGPPPDRRSTSVLGLDGLNCTQLMAPGQYVLTAEVELLSGVTVTDSVEFEVDTRYQP